MERSKGWVLVAVTADDNRRRQEYCKTRGWTLIGLVGVSVTQVKDTDPVRRAMYLQLLNEHKVEEGRRQR